jgi:beta-glucosidase
MTAAAVEGLQGNSPEDLSRPDKIAVVVKHFCAQGAAVGGHNGKTVNIGERELREIHLPTMKAAVSAGAAACMAAYNEIDGVYCSGSRWLLTDVLRGELGFRGFVMSDAGAVDELQKITGSLELAVAKAVKAGVDMNLMNDSYSLLEKDVEDGKIKEEDIDEAVRRILRIKFLLGLFEQPYVKEEDSERKAGREELRRISRQLAQESIVLLKNRNAALPLRGDLQKIVVIGPNADALYNQLGDYTPPQRDGTGTTILDGIRGRVSSGTEVLYARGCGIRDSSTDGIADAVSKTKASQAAIVVVGGSSTRDFDLKFDTNGAAIVGENPSEMDCGEGMDVAELELGGAQLELVKKIVATGTPTVVVLIEGRPHSIPWIAENCDAVLCAWYPGPEGGSAVADVLFGILNPCGRLPVSVPRSSGQLPVFYNYKETDDYLDMKASPQYPFGFGLSYTEFKYGTPSLSTGTVSLAELDDGRAVEVQVSVKNVGRVAGSEVAQLYIRDMEASVSPRNRVLIGFEKIWLEPGEIKTVTFSIGKNELSIWNEEMYFVPEIGNVDIFVGSDSTAAMYTILRITS